MTNCNSCESEKHKELFNIKKHKIVQCQTCNLKYIKNPMTPEESKEYYESEYYQGTDGTASTSCFECRQVALACTRCSSCSSCF